MYRTTAKMTLAACCLVAALGATAAAQEVSLGAARQKITTASAVRARSAPETAAPEVTRLRLGTVVSADARTAAEAEVGSRKDYWYRVALPGGGAGWVFGGLLADYDPARRAEVVRAIIDERLKAETMTFDDGSDLHEFVAGALAGAQGQARAELELARLRALGLAVSQLPGEAGQMSQPQRDFHAAHRGEIYHHELAGAWAVRPEAFWELEKKYHGTPAGDRIAWAAAQALYPGECESDEVCQFLYMQMTEGRYLGLYPRGAHAAEALENLGRALASEALDETLRRKGGEQYAVEEQEALRKALAELRAAAPRAEGPGKAEVLRRLEQLSARAPK